MSSTLGNFGRSLLLARLLTPENTLGFTECHFALMREPAPLGATGTNLSEPNGNGYVRMPYPLGSASWRMSGYATAYNANAITWPAAVAEWGGAIAAWAILTQQQGGDLIVSGTLATQLTVTAGDVVSIPAGGVQVMLRD
jgi:hypothetical protein